MTTVAFLSARRSAIALFGAPSALFRTMRARLLGAAGNKRPRANDLSCEHSSSVSSNSAFGLTVLLAASPLPRWRIDMDDQCQFVAGRGTSAGRQ